VVETLAVVKDLVNSVRGPHGDDFGRHLNQTLANLNGITLSIREILESRKKDISQTLVSLREMTETLSQILDRADRIMAKVEAGEGAVGALLTDKQTGENVKIATSHLKDASSGAAEMFGRFTRIRAFWDYRYRFDAAASVGRSDFGIKLSLRPTRYYFAGVANVGDKATPLKEKDFEAKNTFNVGMGKEFFPWLNLYAGVLRSEGGFGAVVKPFPKSPRLSRMELQAEAYAFGRTKTFNGRELKGAVYNAGAAMDIFPWLKFEARGEDLAQTGHAYGGLRVNLEDKDLAYLFGLLTVTR